MKKLKKILLINWLYFSKELIEVGDVNFLTGKNGAGKSTVIDALQIVLLGETNARNFNQAANEKSQRTLDGYLRADMDEKNPGSRRGKDFSTYIACEFQDEVEGGGFVMGVMFDCRSDGTRRDYFFTYTGDLPENCFIQDGEAMGIPELRLFLKQNYSKAEFYDTQKGYRETVLAKWNVHNPQVLGMMKRAVSFRPIVDIQKFITENICDMQTKPDITLMQQNIREYMRSEQFAAAHEKKLAALQNISRLYREMNQAMERWRIQSFLVLWAEKEVAQAEIDRRESERQDCRDRLTAVTRRLEELSGQIRQKDDRRSELEQARATSSVYQEAERLSTQKKNLEDRRKELVQGMEDLAVNIRKEAVDLKALCGEVLDWDGEEVLLPVQEAAAAVQKAYGAFTGGEIQMFSRPIALFEAAQNAAAGFSEAVRGAVHKIEDSIAGLKAQLEQKNAALENLRKNIKDYSWELTLFRTRLTEELERRTGRSVQIHILADLLEVSDENWRGAVEGYLNHQKFYLLVEPAFYAEALRIYDAIKKEPGFRTFGLVDVGKLREKEVIQPLGSSLAGKIETQNDLARSYVDYLLGRVVCCDRAEQLRSYKTSITAEGMLYQGYVVRAIRREWMEDAFIGRRAVALRIQRLEKEQQRLQEELKRWTPIRKRLSGQKEPLFSAYFVRDTVAKKQEDYLRSLEIGKEVSRLEEKLAQLDILWLGRQDQMINQLKEKIAALDGEKDRENVQKGQLEERIRQLEYTVLPKCYQDHAAKEEQLKEDFPAAYQESTGIPRYQQEFARLKRAEVVRKNFSDSLAQSRKAQENAQNSLFSARREYMEQFRTRPFRADAMDNEEFEEEKRVLEENELPRYREKIKAARESAIEQFRNDFLAKLKSSIEQVQRQVRDLNRALRQAQFGTDRYQFRVDRNPDFADYYDMIMAPELMEGDRGLLALPFQEKYGPLIEKLFRQITMADDTQINSRQQSELQEKIHQYTDFRTYLKFDLETTDQNGSRQLLSQTLNTKSGGETQTPFYIAVLASFAQMYRVNEGGSVGNTVRLVVFDEAFNKMDSDRITESVRLLRKMGLQAIICTPPDKVADIMPIADRTLLVDKNGYRMHILPFGKEIAE